MSLIAVLFFFSDPIQQIYKVVKNGSEQASEMKEETKS